METKKRIENANADEERKILSEPGDDFDLTLDNNFKPNTYIDNSTTTSVTFEIRNNIQQPWKGQRYFHNFITFLIFCFIG